MRDRLCGNCDCIRYLEDDTKAWCDHAEHEGPTDELSTCEDWGPAPGTYETVEVDCGCSPTRWPYHCNRCNGRGYTTHTVLK